MIGVTIGEKHSYNDWGLILSSKIISPPKPKLNQISVPVRDGTIDLTETLTEDIKFEDRMISLTFSVVDKRKTWAEKISDIENYIHGKRMKIVCDDDPAFYYIGRVSVDNWNSDGRVGKLVIKCTVEPFKYDIVSSDVDWEWDLFDFEQGIINETGELIVDVTRDVTLVCRRKRMFPTFIASADMSVIFEGITYNLKAGSQKVYDIFLCEGKNELTFMGKGTVSINYIGGSL